MDGDTFMQETVDSGRRGWGGGVSRVSRQLGSWDPAPCARESLHPLKKSFPMTWNQARVNKDKSHFTLLY